MQLVDFTRDAAGARKEAKTLSDGQCIAIIDSVDGEPFTIASWSHYVADYDQEKLDRYLPVSTKQFGECTSFIVNHTIHTGIGKIITYRDRPRYVLDPGKNWRSYLAARFGISRKRYSSAAQSSRLVERIIEKAKATETSKVRSIKADLAAAEELLQDLAVERAELEQEVRALREETRRRPHE